MNQELLKSAKLKVTPARLAILNIFSEECFPVNVDYIFLKLNNLGIDEATVYRNIKILQDKKIIRIVDLRKDSTYFELSTHHHHHLVCGGCGLIEPVSGCVMDKEISNYLNKSKKFATINEHAFELFGTCNSCHRKNK